MHLRIINLSKESQIISRIIILYNMYCITLHYIALHYIKFDYVVVPKIDSKSFS